MIRYGQASGLLEAHEGSITEFFERTGEGLGGDPQQIGDVDPPEPLERPGIVEQEPRHFGRGIGGTVALQGSFQCRYFLGQRGDQSNTQSRIFTQQGQKRVPLYMDNRGGVRAFCRCGVGNLFEHSHFGDQRRGSEAVDGNRFRCTGGFEDVHFPFCQKMKTAALLPLVKEDFSCTVMPERTDRFDGSELIAVQMTEEPELSQNLISG